MSNLSTKERAALKDSDFGDPDRKLFPIMDQSDVDAAAHLIGKAQNPAAVKAKIIAICKRKGFTIPAAWQTDAKMTATFAMNDDGRRVEGAWAVYPNSLLFEAGSYPDKDFEMSPEEMWLAVDNFKPITGNIEHTKFLKGRACEVRNIWQDANDPFVLRGEVSVPLGLDLLMEDHERKLSCEWAKDTKALTGIGLVIDPRVPEAALMTAYAEFAAATRHDTPTGQMAMQELHNTAARAGAVCSKGNANMASQHESSAIQKVHDLTTEHGATCASMTPGQSSTPYPMFGADASASSSIPASSSAATSLKEGRNMSWKDRLLAAISGMPDEDTGDPAPPVATPAPAPVALSTAPDSRDAEMARMRQERDAAQAETHRIRTESINREAVAFADRMIVTEQRAFPAAREAIITGHQQAALDDVAYGVVTFGEGQTTTRVARFEAVIMAAPAHQLTAESLTPALMSVLQGHRDTPTQDTDRKATPDELEKLLNMTSQGQAVVAMSRGQNHTGATNGRA